MNTLFTQIFPSLVASDNNNNNSTNNDSAVAAASTMLLVQKRDFEDPITYSIFADPVTCEDGHTYDRPVIERCFQDRIEAEQTRQRRQRNGETAASSSSNNDDSCCGGANDEPIELLSPISNQVVSGILVPNIILEQQIVRIMEANIFGLDQEELDDWQQRRNEKKIRDRQRHEEERREQAQREEWQRNARQAEQRRNQERDNQMNSNRNNETQITTITGAGRARTYFVAPVSEPNRFVRVRADRDIQVLGHGLTDNDVGLSVALAEDSALMPVSLFSETGLRCTVSRCAQRLNQSGGSSSQRGSQQSWCARCARVVCLDCLSCDVTLISDSPNTVGTNVAYLRTFGGQWVHRICTDCVSQLSEVVDQLDQTSDERLRRSNCLLQQKLEQNTDRFVTRAVSLADMVARHEARNRNNLVATALEENIALLERQRAHPQRRHKLVSDSRAQAMERIESRLTTLADRLRDLPLTQQNSTQPNKPRFFVRIQPGVDGSGDFLNITPTPTTFPNTISLLRNILKSKHRSYPAKAKALSKSTRFLRRYQLKQEMEQSYRRWLESLREVLEQLLNAQPTVAHNLASELLTLLDHTSRFIKMGYGSLGVLAARNELSSATAGSITLAQTNSRPDNDDDDETDYGAHLFCNDNDQNETNCLYEAEEDRKPAARPSSLNGTITEEEIQAAREDLGAIGAPLPFQWGLPLRLQYPTTRMSQGLELLQDIVRQQRTASEQTVDEEWADFLQTLISRQDELQGRSGDNASRTTRLEQLRRERQLQQSVARFNAGPSHHQTTRLEQLREHRQQQERERVARRQRREEEATQELFCNAAQSRQIGAEWLGGSGVLRMCGRCKAGPVENQACANLETHNDRSTTYKGHRVASRKNPNHCPNCGWFNADYKRWPIWDGVYGPH